MSKQLFIGLIVLLIGASAHGEEPQFREALGDYTLQFPRDHGAHPDYATEWWYFTGHLQAEKRTFGFELVFFRIGLNPENTSTSAWATPSLYLMHYAITDDKQQKFFVSEKRSRGNFRSAGANLENLRVWQDSAVVELKENLLTLSAQDAHSSLALSLRPAKPLVLHGEKGLSRKGPRPGDASYYSSFTRLLGVGTLTLEGKEIALDKASVWMDHEFSSSKLSRDTLGWDWFAVQLENGEELMLYQLRHEDGSISAFSSGTFVHKNGEAETIHGDEFSVEVLEHWTSPTTKIKYPSKWQLKVPRLKLDLRLTPTVANQELVTKESTGVTYWEGRNTAVGKSGDSDIHGNAYVELVGYH